MSNKEPLMSDDKALNLAIAQINMDQELLISSTWALYDSPSNPKIRIFFLLTEFTIYLFKPINSGAQMKLLSSFSLFDLKGGEAYSSEHFSIFFVDKILSFYGESIIFLLDLIVTQLTSMLLPNEVPSFKGELHVGVKSPIPFQSLLLRFRGKLKSINRYPPQTFLDELQAYLKTEPTEFYISQFKDINNYIEVLLESIEIEPLITCLVFTGEQQINHWNLLSVFIRNNTTIKRIIISENVNRGFVDFCAALSKNDKSSLKRIDFMNVTFLPEHIEALDKMIRIHHFLSLSFTNCNIDKSKSNFITLLNSNENGINVVSLHFTSMNLSKSLDFSAATFQLSFLSLRGCCLQLSTLFTQMKNTRIVKADFSKNRSTEPIPIDIEFPKTLKFLCLNDIQWNYTNFSVLFKIISFNQIEMGLSIARAEMSENDWVSSFDFLSSLGKTNLISLNWRENPIHYKLCHFIAKSSRIWFCSFAGCHLPCDGSLARLIASCQSIKALDIHGTVNNKLNENGYSLLKSILSSNIEYLDISNNNLGNKNILLLAKILTKPSLKQILIDKNNFTSPKIALLFQNSILSRKQTEQKEKRDNGEENEDFMLYAKYPDNDFKSLQKPLEKELKKIFITPSFPNPRNPAEEEWLLCLSQKYEQEKEIHLVDDPDFVLPNAEEFLAGSDAFWNITLINEIKKMQSDHSTEREQISWDLNTIDIPTFDTTNIANQLSQFFSLENNTERLMLSW